MTKLILGASVASLLSSSAFAALLTLPNDPVFGVQLQNGTTISVATEGGSGNAFPSPGEDPSQSIDADNGSKYLNFGELNTGIVVDPTDDLLVLTGLQLVTGGDAPARDPATFSIYGTNVTQSTLFSDYTPIVLNMPILATDPGRGGTSNFVTFTNSSNSGFDSYLVIFPTVRDPEGTNANSMQVAEILLDGTAAIPEPSTLGLLGLTTIGISALRRRRA